MANENKINEQQSESDEAKVESNVDRDRDHGNMNNGTIGGNMGVIGNSNEEKEEQPSKKTS